MRTKIIATVGPATSDINILKSMFLKGVNVIRVNFSHGNHEFVSDIIKKINQLNEELKLNIAILGDLQGPKIRVSGIPETGLLLEDGKELYFSTNPNFEEKNKVFISYKNFPLDVKNGENIQLDDGKFLLQIIETNKIDTVKARIIHGGLLLNKKGVNLPDTKLSISSLTEKDLEDLEFILKNKFHWIALSFVRNANDIKFLKTKIKELGFTEDIPAIIAKIEKPEAVENIDEIIKISDAIMVARGDLGVELPMEKVPGIQKSIISKCLKESKQVIVATQMMESMIDNIRPTRAETNDVANAVYDGTDAVMLSAETSVGKFPIIVIDAISKIINEVEKSKSIYNKFHEKLSDYPNRLISDSVLDSSCVLAKESKCDAIVLMTYTGYSAARVAAQRPGTNIFVVVNNDFLARKLSLLWGVKCFYYDNIEKSTSKTLDKITKELKKIGYLHNKNLVLHVMSSPVYGLGKTNSLKLEII